MKRRMLMLMAAALALLSASGQVEFTGWGDDRPFEETPDWAATNLNKVYVLRDITGVKMTYNSPTGERPIWQIYDYRNGVLQIDTINPRWDGFTSTLDNIRPNKGYIIQVGNETPFRCWVVNYADYELSLNDMSLVSDDPRSKWVFHVDGEGHEIPYWSVNGHRMVLDREIKLTYGTQVWNSDSPPWQDVYVDTLYRSLDEVIEIDPPYLDTDFRLTGDRFLEYWGDPQGIETNIYEATAVACRSTAELLDREEDDDEEGGEIEGEDDGEDDGTGDGDTETDDSDTGIPNKPLSAPVHIRCTGYPTAAVEYRVWELSRDPEFVDIIQSDYVDVVEYTFVEYGTYYIRYMVDNRYGTCPTYGEVYTVQVATSSLDYSNVFSPGSGVYDVWKVKSESLIEFHCWIFNRWGNLVYEFTDPSTGWDGSFRGKPADAGVYYFVITATGADGVKYNKRGDITILRYKGTSGISNGTAGTAP